MPILFSFTLFTSCTADQAEYERDEIYGGCPEIYDPVCAQPPMPECPEGMMCAQVMPPVKTYVNECEMKKDGATLVSAGECPEAEDY